MKAISSVNVRGTVTDRGKERMHDVPISYFVVSRLGRHLVSVNVATKPVVVALVETNELRLEAGSLVLPLVRLVHDQYLYTFLMNLSDYGDQGPGVPMHVRASANLCHQRLGHVGTKSSYCRR